MLIRYSVASIDYENIPPMNYLDNSLVPKIFQNETIRSRFAITYGNVGLNDGAGAQLQRILGIYALSRGIGLQYYYSGLALVDFQGLKSLEFNVIEKDLHVKWNRLFNLSGYTTINRNAHNWTEVHLGWPTWEVMEDAAKAIANGTYQYLLGKMTTPHRMADLMPDILDHAVKLSPFNKTASNLTRVAIHVRRGDEFAWEQGRMLPNKYFVKVATAVVEHLKAANVKFIVELHTEVPTKPFNLTKDSHYVHPDKPFLMDPHQNKIEDFDVIPKLEKHLNEDPMKTMEQFCTADILIMSRSSFSHVGGLLNRGVVLYPPGYWHAALSRWVKVSDQWDDEHMHGMETLKQQVKDYPWPDPARPYKW